MFLLCAALILASFGDSALRVRAEESTVSSGEGSSAAEMQDISGSSEAPESGTDGEGTNSVTDPAATETPGEGQSTDPSGTAPSSSGEPSSADPSETDPSSTEPESTEEPEPPGPQLQPLSPFLWDQEAKPLTLALVLDELNLREDAGIQNPIKAVLQENDMVKVTGPSKKSPDGVDWYPVLTGGGWEGWLSGDYLRILEIGENDDTYRSYLRFLGFSESYLNDLAALHAQYPAWLFFPYQTNINWSKALYEEANPPHYMGLNLIHGNTISSWKSTKSGAYDWTYSVYPGGWKNDWDSGNWVIASDELVAYFLDPRNFLDSTYVFMFLDQRYNTNQTIEGVQAIAKNSFLLNTVTDVDGTSIYYPEVIYRAGQEIGISPYLLTSMILQEIGPAGTSDSISGTNSLFPGVYNYYNCYAYKTLEHTAIEHGLWYASGGSNGATSYSRPWNTRAKAIYGGAQYYANNFVLKAQTTLYFKKFNVVSSPYYSLYRHQYMTNVRAAYSEAKLLAAGYSEEVRQGVLQFTIPVYNNMPASKCACPTKDGSPNNKLAMIYVDEYELFPAFDMDTPFYSVTVPYEAASVSLSVAAFDSKARVEGLGTVDLIVGSNEFTIKVTAENGDEREYGLTIVREEEKEEPPEPPTEPSTDPTEPSTDPTEPSTDPTEPSTDPTEPPTTEPQPEPVTVNPSYRLWGEDYLSGFDPGTTAETVIAHLGISGPGTGSIRKADGSQKGGGETVATGDRAVVTNAEGAEVAVYTLILLGDVNGDGKINLSDMIKIRNHNLATSLLSGVFAQAGDINHDTKINLSDMIKVRNHNLGTTLIEQ